MGVFLCANLLVTSIAAFIRPGALTRRRLEVAIIVPLIWIVEAVTVHLLWVGWIDAFMHTGVGLCFASFLWGYVPVREHQ